MPRLPRYALPGVAQHVIQRGNNRDVIFGDDEDRTFFLETLAEACARFECALHAYVLMTNHVHLLITPNTEDGLGKMMQSLGRRYVQYFNAAYRRTGTLWEGRYRATVVDAEGYVLTCMRYIELNPVRARMVRRPGDYAWSSHGANGRGAADPPIAPHQVYRRLGATQAERRQAYRALFRAALDDDTLKGIREATNKGWALGSTRFKAKVERLTARRAAPKPRGGDRKSARYKKSAKINRL